MPNVVVQTIERLTMNAAAEANTGRQRAASHNSGANNSVTGPTVAKSSHRWNMASPHVTANATTANAPSMNSLRESRSREDEMSSISNGATVMIPSPSDSNHCCQVVNSGVAELWSNSNVTAPPIPETAVPIIAAATNPSTLRSLPSLKPDPK